MRDGEVTTAATLSPDIGHRFAVRCVGAIRIAAMAGELGDHGIRLVSRPLTHRSLCFSTAEWDRKLAAEVGQDMV